VATNRELGSRKKNSRKKAVSIEEREGGVEKGSVLPKKGGGVKYIPVAQE